MKLLEPYRKRIDDLDDQIVDLLAARLQIIHEVAALKEENNIPAVLQDRVDEVINRCAARASAKGMDQNLARELYTKIVKHCCDLEERIMKKSA